jgi:radical SAM protein with 4Fe4S-binding SPASM domain
VAIPVTLGPALQPRQEVDVTLVHVDGAGAAASGALDSSDRVVLHVEDRLRLGNLHEQPLDEIASSPLAAAFRARKRRGDPACESCRWLPICNHGCPLMRDHNPQRDATGHRTNYLCSAYQQIFRHAEERLRELAVRVPPPPRPTPPAG